LISSAGAHHAWGVDVLFTFADHTLDDERRELRRAGELLAVEPQVFDVLTFLISNRERVVSKDDLIASVWGGRIVSESTVTSRINAARTAVNDTGRDQRLIRTIARKGFRFVAEVRSAQAGTGASITTDRSLPREAAAAQDTETAALGARRASVAVLPFSDRSAPAGLRDDAGAALAHDVITRLAKLRSLFVIAEGTASALHERGVGPDEAGRLLNVDYVAGGVVSRAGDRLIVTVELTEVRTARIIWTDRFDRTSGDALLVLNEIGDSIVSAIASEIETLDRNRAMLRPPSSLDAWGAYHRGLWHMYRFSEVDNAEARGFFEMAIRLDPTFSRAHAGLSFTHWQDVFQGWAARGEGVERAYAAAGRSLMADDRDPAAHLAMGRALWLMGRHDPSVAELEQAVELSPNYALAHYNLSFVQATGGEPQAAITASDRSRSLSPFDPMLFGMLANRALALARLGEFEEAAAWSVKAAARPNAHAHILAISGYCLAMADRPDEARDQMVAVRRSLPRYEVSDLVSAMQLDHEGETLFRLAAARLGER
jgi:DNA-binding winged helix-turn-helix (wHTH) protein/tetratricopeptide (TPR) repeat protein